MKNDLTEKWKRFSIDDVDQTSTQECPFWAITETKNYFIKPSKATRETEKNQTNQKERWGAGEKIKAWSDWGEYSSKT